MSIVHSSSEVVANMRLFVDAKFGIKNHTKGQALHLNTQILWNHNQFIEYRIHTYMSDINTKSVY